ncbi:MAG: phosphoribosylglycinamide formyltransferase [archaeon]
MELRLGFLASHTGSNVEAILNSIDTGVLTAQPKIIITNNPGAEVLAVAKKYGVASRCLNANNHAPYPTVDEAILQILIASEVNLVLLAGYMKRIGQNVIRHYSNAILNIHPALLPKYGGQGMYGMNVHDAVIKSADTDSGATVHLVDEHYDTGRILLQSKVPRHTDDTAATLAKRVLETEHALYTEVLKRIQEDELLLN